MAGGIMQHGKIKTFLTRGIFGDYFRPILYSNVDKINYTYIEVITATMKAIDKKILLPNKLALQIWFALAPLYHFELLFLPDKNNKALIPMLEKAEINNGKECAYFTQGFIIYHFEQLLINSPEFKEKMKLSAQDIDAICHVVFGEGNKTISYLNNFRMLFNSNNFDPRDRPIFYVYEATKLFIKDNQTQKLAIQDWDDDEIGKFRFINGFVEFLSIQKDNSLKMLA
ncbi:MAG: hypothetical protein M0Q51_14560 [Bacteroidales bacterium]|nr:hypothetical protein [Bacteroidales bacterium]